MMTLATGTDAVTTRGFTLLEVMLVLLLLSLGATLVVANRPGGHYHAQREALRLAQRLNALTRQAAIDGRTYGLRLDGDRWQLKEWRQREWRALSLRGGRDEQRLPAEWRLILSVSGAQTMGNDPQILILPGGEITPFRLRYLHNARLQAELACDDDGHIALTEPTDAAP